MLLGTYFTSFAVDGRGWSKTSCPVGCQFSYSEGCTIVCNSCSCDTSCEYGCGNCGGGGNQ